MNKSEYIYWITLAHLQKFSNLKKNEIIIKCKELELELSEFFSLSEDDWREKFSLNDNEMMSIKNSIEELPKNSFLLEDLLAQGYELIPVTSLDYSPVLKQNLKRTYAPPLIYIKGNKKILKEDSIAIVGSREASEISLSFTDNIAQQASKNFKVIVSGFAKGIDKHALDCALKYLGHSIIVLPQGIMTFGSGFNTYYKQITEGDVLVLSTYHPKAPWSVQLAMGRNPIIYGLASEIYVAESSDSGGTWSGVLDGLRKGRKIFVRKTEPNESNANNKLIQKGATAVDMDGNEIVHTINLTENTEETYLADIRNKIIDLLTHNSLTAKEIKEKLNLDESEKDLKSLLKSFDNVKTKSKKYFIENELQQKLF